MAMFSRVLATSRFSDLNTRVRISRALWNWKVAFSRSPLLKYTDPMSRLRAVLVAVHCHYTSWHSFYRSLFNYDLIAIQFHYSVTDSFRFCVFGWSGPSILRYMWYALVAISVAAAMFPFSAYTTFPMLTQESATSGNAHGRTLLLNQFDILSSLLKWDLISMLTLQMVLGPVLMEDQVLAPLRIYGMP